MNDSACLNPKLQKALKPRLTKYNLPIDKLTKKQIVFLLLQGEEAFYGGAAGGAKTAALIQAALQYVDVPGYNAILMRDTYANMIKPDGLIEQTHKFLAGTDAKWCAEKKSYVFPTGGAPATLSFGYMDGPMDHFKYQGPAYQYVGIDEVVGIRENQYLYMFSRTRKLSSHGYLPLRMRSASNPPAREQQARGAWVKQRFIDLETKEDNVPYVRAKVKDNPYLDEVTYNKSLEKLDPVTREQLKNGDWDVSAEGRYMRKEDFIIVQSIPDNVIRWCSFWDMAATEPLTPSHDPDYTCHCFMGMTADKKFIIANMLRFRKSPAETDRIFLSTVKNGGRSFMGAPIAIRQEQEGGSSGKIVIEHYKKELLGWDFKGQPTGRNSKFQRSTPFMNAVGDRRVMILADCCNSMDRHNPYTVKKFIANQELYPDGPHDDDTDAPSGAYTELTTKASPRIREV